MKRKCFLIDFCAQLTFRDHGNLFWVCSEIPIFWQIMCPWAHVANCRRAKTRGPFEILRYYDLDNIREQGTQYIHILFISAQNSSVSVLTYCMIMIIIFFSGYLIGKLIPLIMKISLTAYCTSSTDRVLLKNVRCYFD